MRVPETPPFSLSGGVLVLANDTAVHLVPVKSSARNTIETVFCHRRNHISASALNATSQQMTNGGRVPAERALTIPEGQKKEATMKRCAQCHGKLRLGVRSRNLWNGRW